MKYIYKCDDFTARSSTTMAGYILSQCSPEDIITLWFKLINTMPALYNDDMIIGEFCLNDLLFMYRNNILADKIYDTASDFVEVWITDKLERYAHCSMPMIDIPVNINNFHIRIIRED